MNNYTSVVFYPGPKQRSIYVYEDYYRAKITFVKDSVGSMWKIREEQLTNTIIHYYHEKKS